MSEIRPIKTKLDFLNQSNIQNNLLNVIDNTVVDVITPLEYNIETNYDFEAYESLYIGSTMSSGNIQADFNTSEIDIEYFNEYINTAVNTAGYGSREAITAAAIALVVGYIKFTGQTINYSWDPSTNDNHRRPDPATVGVPNTEEFGLDCSGLVMWSIYNGGYNIPLTGYEVETDNMYNWAYTNGYTRDDITTGNPGDFMITRGKGHTMLIVGTDEDGYWCAEENPGVGATITHYSYSDLGRYCLVDMTDYYNNPENLRKQ